MSFFGRLLHLETYEDAKRVVGVVYDLLFADNRQMDRKRLDSVEIAERAIVIRNWGFDAEEAERKQQHTVKVLVACGLIVDDHGCMHAEAVMSGIEGIVAIPLAENGGAAAILDKISHSGLWQGALCRKQGRAWP